MKLIADFVLCMLALVLFSGDGYAYRTETKALSKIETFAFLSNGKNYNGKIFLPDSFQTNQDLPAIYLIDFTEQHFKVATDEFEKVINGVEQIPDIDALVVTLEEILNIDAKPQNFEEHYTIYKDMVAYVEANYSRSTSVTFIGKGSESGVVLMALFLETSEKQVFDNFIVTDPSPLYASAVMDLIKNGEMIDHKQSKKLHFSFSTSNDRTKCTQLIKLITEAQYPWLQFESVEYTNSNYENTYPISYAEGLKYVFKN